MTSDPSPDLPRGMVWWRRGETLAFVGLIALIAVTYGLLIRAQLSYGLEYDESYLLNVVRNIAEGAGFVDDGVSFFSTGVPFEPNISSGPTLLLPGAMVWRLTGGDLTVLRLVPLAFFTLYLAVTAYLFWRWRGRWAAAAALSGALLLPVLLPDLTNRSLMPGRFIGEIAALSLLMLSAALLERRSYVMAGFAAGFAVQAKLNYALPVLVLFMVWILIRWLRGEHGWRWLVMCAPGIILPTLLFEAYKLVSLGIGGYADNLSLVRHFNAQNTVGLAAAPNSTLAKMAALLQLTSGPAIVLAVTLTALLIAAYFLQPYLTQATAADAYTDAGLAVAALCVSTLSLLAWWAASSTQESPRPAVPVAMFWLSLLMATLATVPFDLRARASGRLRLVLIPLPMAVALLIILAIAFQGAKVARNTTGSTLLAEQQQAAAAIVAASPTLPIDDFWTNPEFSVLTDLPYQTDGRDNPSLLVFTSIRALTERGRPDATLYAGDCGVILYASTNVVVCQPKGQ